MNRTKLFIAKVLLYTVSINSGIFAMSSKEQPNHITQVEALQSALQSQLGSEDCNAST